MSALGWSFMGAEPVAAGWVRAHVCGYAQPHRSEKPLAFLQAYTDDSGSDIGDRRLFMAGYLNSAENWARFEVAWSEELQAAPAIKYLHMVEANNRRGQFRGWSEEDRDEKLRGLARVIRHFQPISFEFSASRADYDALVKPVSPRGIAPPHFPCAFGVVALIARYVHGEGVKVPIDFIFDAQDGVSGDLVLFFEYMKKNIPKGPRKLINGVPIFRDDRQVLPLQAADMLAWHLRREHEGGGGMGSLPMADLLRNPKAHLVSGFDAVAMRKWSDAFDQMLPAISQMQSKTQWQKLRREIVRQQALGYIPPYGTRWKNFVYASREALARFKRR